MRLCSDPGSLYALGSLWGVGGLANSKTSLSEKTGAFKLLEGGGVSEFRSLSEKETVFMPPLTGIIGLVINVLAGGTLFLNSYDTLSMH